MIGLRNQSVGTDTATYIYEFNGEIRNLDMTIFDNPEPLYTILLTICQKLFNNYTGFLCVFAFPYIPRFCNLFKALF